MSDHFGTIPIEPTEATPSPPPPRVERHAPKRTGKTIKQRQQPPRHFRLLLLFILPMIIFSSYLAIGFWGIPHYIKTTLPLIAEQKTGLSLNVDRVTFNPLSFKLEITDVTIHEKNGTDEPLLSLQRFTADIAPLPLIQGKIITNRLIADTFDLQVTRNSEGNYNIYTATGDSTSKPETAAFDLSSLPFHFSFNNISLENGKITFHDKPNNNIHLIEEIQLSLPNLSNFSFQAKEYIRPQFSAVINGSPVQLTGQAALTGNSKDTDVRLKTELSCNFNAIDLNRYFDYLPFVLPFDITSGKAQGTLKLTFSQSKNDDLLSVDFSMQASKIALSSADESFALQVPSVKLEGSLQPLTGNTQLKSLELREPTVYISEDFSFAQFRALASLATAKSENSATDSKNPKVHIDLLLADNGTLVLTGDSPENIKDQWQALQLTIKNYSNVAGNTSPEPASFRLSGEQSETRATLNWQGNIDEHLLPIGDLHLTNIAAVDLFRFLGFDGVEVKTGSADLLAYLSFKDYPDVDLNSRITVSEGTVTLNDLSLVNNGQSWYSAPTVKFTGFAKNGKKLSLGSVYLKNSTMSLQTDALPSLISKLGGEKGSVTVEALDYSGTITISNTTRQLAPLAFTNISLQAVNLSRLESSSERDNLTFTANLGKTGEVVAKGKVRLNSFITTLTTGFSGIDGSQLLPWFGNSTLFKELSLQLAGKGQFSFPYVSYEGQLLLQNGSLTKNDKAKTQPYFSWKEIDLQDFRYNSNPLHIGASLCNITAPQLSINHTAKGPHPLLSLHNFLAQHFHTDPQPSAAEATAKLPVLELQKVAFAEGSVKLSDSRLSKTWTGEIGALHGSIEKLSSDPVSPSSPIALSGELNMVPFTLLGSVHLFNLGDESKTTFTLNDFPIAAFRDFLKKQVEIDTSRGTVSLVENMTVNNGNLNQESELTFNNVVPLSPSSDTALTLALLKDNTDSFTLSEKNIQPLEGPRPPLVTSTLESFKKLILKAAVSPVLLAGTDYSDLMGKEFVEFEPGKILLAGKGQETLARFSGLLTSRPQLAITITGSADTVIDAEAMKTSLEKAEEKRVFEENFRRSSALQKETEEYLLAAAEKRKSAGNSQQIVEEQIPKELYKRYAPVTPEKVVIDKSMLKELATERARVVAELLIDNLTIAPEQVNISKKYTITKGDNSGGNKVLFTITTISQP